MKNPIDDYLDCDFYAVEEEKEGKSIHILGYFYYAGDGEKPYRALDYTWLCFPLEKFLEMDEDDLDLETESVTQYIEDLTEEEVKQEMETYFDGNPGTPLLYEQLTKDTPPGNYINVRR